MSSWSISPPGSTPGPVPATVIEATDRAASALAAFVDEPVAMIPHLIRRCPTLALPRLLGRPSVPVVGIYLGFSGDLDGHVVLLLRRRGANHLAARLLGECRDRHDPLVRSALGEVGNITVSSFLGILADRRHLALRPTPPIVVDDTAGAILDGIVADLAGLVDEAPVVEVTIVCGTIRAGGTLVILPRPTSGPSVLGALGGDE